MAVTIHATRAGEASEEVEAVSDAAIEAWREVPVAVAVDLAGGIVQIDPAIRPILPPGGQKRLFGRAVTARCEPPDFGAVLHALDLVSEGDVLVIAAGGRSDTAMIGEILAGALGRNGAAGIVCDGAVRDIGTLASWPELPVFARHVTPRGPTSATKGDVNASVSVGGAIVRPGDLVIGDDDGLVVLTPDQVRERIGEAQAKLALEAEWQAGFAAGHSAQQIFGLAPAERLGD